MCMKMKIDDPAAVMEILMYVKGIRRHDRTMAEWESTGLARKLAACDCLEFFRKDRDRYLSELYDILDRLDGCFYDIPLAHEIIHMDFDEVHVRLEKHLKDNGLTEVLEIVRSMDREFEGCQNLP